MGTLSPHDWLRIVELSRRAVLYRRWSQSPMHRGMTVVVSHGKPVRLLREALRAEAGVLAIARGAGAAL